VAKVFTSIVSQTISVALKVVAVRDLTNMSSSPGGLSM
jgi:hypothetical protein